MSTNTKRGGGTVTKNGRGGAKKAPSTGGRVMMSSKSKKSESKKIRHIGKKFAAQSFVPGLYHEETPGNVLVTMDDGTEYEVNVTLTTRREGIVSVADAKDLIDTVTCVDNSTIEINFVESLT